MLSRGALPAFILSMALVALADPVPSTPSQGQEGGTCQISWTPDSTGLWKVMNIQLMTGDNLQMVPLTTVTTVDGTASPGTYSYPCPSVTPNAPIYFYQFSHNASDLVWTTRFAIADSSGATVPAPNATQPDGQAIPWGTGALTDPSKAVAPPSYFPGGSSTGSNTAPVVSTSGSASSPTPSVVVVSSSTGTNTPQVAAVPSGTSGSASPAAASSAAPASSANGAVMLGAVSARAAQAGVALAVIAGAFTFMV